MAKMDQNKQDKLTDLLGQLPGGLIERSTEEALRQTRTRKSHPALRWVAIAAAAVMIVGVMCTASIMGSIAWKKYHPVGSAGISTRDPGQIPEEELPLYQGETYTAVLSRLADFLTNEGFVPEISQSTMKEDILPRYRFGGLSVMDIAPSNYMDGITKDGVRIWSWGGGNGEFSFSSGFLGVEIKSRFETSKLPEGLVLPCQIDFSDSLPGVLQKIGLPYEIPEAEKKSTGSSAVLLLSEGGRTLIFSKDEKTDTDLPELRFVLTFCETTHGENGSDDAPVKRELEFRFADCESGIAKLALRVRKPKVN